MLGVKEVAANIPSVEPRLSLFGTRRKPEDEVRKVCATSWLPVIIYRALKISILRRAVYVVTQALSTYYLNLNSEVETLTYALARNITAVILVLALIAQSTRLLLGVVHESFANQVKWDELGFQINTSSPYIYVVGFDFLYIATFTLSLLTLLGS
jgi:hypothetical protein